jgi:hypothetical protein
MVFYLIFIWFFFLKCSFRSEISAKLWIFDQWGPILRRKINSSEKSLFVIFFWMTNTKCPLQRLKIKENVLRAPFPIQKWILIFFFFQNVQNHCTNDLFRNIFAYFYSGGCAGQSNKVATDAAEGHKREKSQLHMHCNGGMCDKVRSLLKMCSLS